MHRKGTWEDSCYFDEELSSKNNDNNKKIENNKINEKNKENIPENEPHIVWFSNKVIQTSLV